LRKKLRKKIIKLKKRNENGEIERKEKGV